MPFKEIEKKTTYIYVVNYINLSILFLVLFNFFFCGLELPLVPFHYPPQICSCLHSLCCYCEMY